MSKINISSELEIRGVGRDAGHEKAISIAFNRQLSDNEIRELHAYLSRFKNGDAHRAIYLRSEGDNKITVSVEAVIHGEKTWVPVISEYHAYGHIISHIVEPMGISKAFTRHINSTRREQKFCENCGRFDLHNSGAEICEICEGQHQ